MSFDLLVLNISISDTSCDTFTAKAAVSESLVNGVRDWSDTSNESSDSDDAAHPGPMHLMVFSVRAQPRS